MPNEMPMLDCRAAMQQLWDYVDEELTPDRMALVKRHLVECAHCHPHEQFAERFLTALHSTREDRSCPQEVREQALTYMACRGAIKAGDPLAPAAIAALLGQLDEIPVASHCPHGRPLWRVISYQDIRQSFRR